MTFGQVNRLRRSAIKELDIRPGMSVLDLGAGGGQISSQIQKLYPDCSIFPSDFNADMIRADKNHTSLPFSRSDARRLPHPDNSFDRVICGFLLRNIRDYPTRFGRDPAGAETGWKIRITGYHSSSRQHLHPIHLAAYAGVDPDHRHTGDRQTARV